MNALDLNALAIGAAEGVDYGMPYNAGSGVAVSVGEMIEQVRTITGVHKPVATDEARLRPAPRLEPSPRSSPSSSRLRPAAVV